MDWPGRRCRARPVASFIGVVGTSSASAKAESAPGSAEPAAAPTATATTAAAATATATAAAATAPGNLNAGLGRCGVFLVEHVERRQADVCDFFLTEGYLMTKSDGG